ncbi:MAG: gliding motility lipoprotein GldH [Bacteroidetes bacterium]|nr:gliding motility lipoprotein GldH [Bacteroidota bacterium]
MNYGFFPSFLQYNRFSIGFLAGLCLIVNACGPSDYFLAAHELPPSGWTYQDTVSFKFNIEDTLSTYRLWVDLKYRDTFPYQNLYLRISTRFPDGRRISKPYSFDLFDLKGASNGNCSGHTCLLESTLQEKALFKKPGQYELCFEQYMRKDSIPAIHSIGLRIQKITQAQ